MRALWRAHVHERLPVYACANAVRHTPRGALHLAGEPLMPPRQPLPRALRTGLPPTFVAPTSTHDDAGAGAGAGACRAQAAVFWRGCREGRFDAPTPGAAPGLAQANLVVLPAAHAFDFLCFALRNPRQAPLLDVGSPGVRSLPLAAPGINVFTDLPRYIVWKDGEPEREATDVAELASGDMVAFALGCSFSWEAALADAGLVPRHVELGRNVPMYRTAVPNEPAGPFGGNLVVSMRPYAPADIPRVCEITGRYPGAHGAPLAWGEDGVAALGIATPMNEPDFGNAVDVREGEVPVFWACGVSTQCALEAAGDAVPLAITHAPGHMAVLSLLDSELVEATGDGDAGAR